ncbi:[FeFe] hydrogenase, group A [Patescibacteria group bacterium]|nr:[FeFe] hydrogenase, group A [Patescibacteria group bacterium]
MDKGKIKIRINDIEIFCAENLTILEIAKENNIEIQTLCYHPDLYPAGECGICIVEIAGESELKRACSTKVTDGMNIMTDSEKVKNARKLALEKLFEKHTRKCPNCIDLYHCKLLKLAALNGVKFAKIEPIKSRKEIYKFGPSIVFDASKCIACGNCVMACAKQGIGFYTKKKDENGENIVVPTENEKIDCIDCAQCINHCPVGAISSEGEFENIEKAFNQKGKVIAVQFAPSIRTSIGEEFNMPYGAVVTEKLVGAIRALGVDLVFDTSTGADFTTFEEANELIERLKDKESKLPMFTSCCPSWVKFVEFYHPELIPNLTKVRSPQAILGGIIKTYVAEKKGIDPKDIIVISIMPCVAKKAEIQRKELLIDGMKPVDHILTTREFARLLKKRGIKLAEVKESKPDSPLADHSGAGVIYGASGGVMESALRTAYFKLTGKELEEIGFTKVRGMDEVKRAEIDINGRKIKVGVVNGLGNARKILQELQVDPKKYDYIEVMSCPGGCIGGGGQPLPTSSEIRKKRAESLYLIDSTKQKRQAHKNPSLQKVYEDYMDEDKIKKILYCSFNPRPRGSIDIKKL